MKFAKYYFKTICILLILSLLIAGSYQIIDMQNINKAKVFRSSSLLSKSFSKESIFSCSTYNSLSHNESNPLVPPNNSNLQNSKGSIVIKNESASGNYPETTRPKSLPIDKVDLDEIIGTSKSKIVSIYGKPQAYELSEYGFTWYIYNKEYKYFFMIGITDDRVVGVYSNSLCLYLKGMTIGKRKSEVRHAFFTEFGKPILSIRKGTTIVTVSNSEQKDIFYNKIIYATVFYDNIEGGALTSVMLIEKNTEQHIVYYGSPNTELTASYERISFYLINSIRVRKGFSSLSWDDRLASVSRTHSIDMLVNNYFDHTDTCGLNSSMRLESAGIKYRICAENIAMNHPSAICAHEIFMNSAGHRKNVLGPFSNVGIGAYMKSNKILLTQDFVAYK